MQTTQTTEITFPPHFTREHSFSGGAPVRLTLKPDTAENGIAEYEDANGITLKYRRGEDGKLHEVQL